VTRIAIKPNQFPWYDYSRYTFSLGIKVGNRVMLSGHTASEHDSDSKTMVVRGGMAEQVRTAYAKIAAILEAGGQSLVDVVRVVEYVTTTGIERYPEAAQVRDEVFGLNRPVVNTVVVKSLLRPQAFIEIEVTASSNLWTAESAERRETLPAWVPARAMDGIVYLSSLIPHDDFGGVVAPGNVVAQTRAIFDRASQILKGFGLGMKNVVKTVDYLTTEALPNYKNTARIRRDYLAPAYPAATGIIMPRVSHPGAMIQIDFIASQHPKAIVNPGWSRYADLTYSPAVRAGDSLFIAGMAALDPANGNSVHAGNIAAQAAYVYENILLTVAAAGGGPEHLVKTVEYVTSAGLPLYREVGGVRTSLLREPYPPSTGVICERLLRPECQIEIDSMAILD
jgi:enamine deaminase RidA (YjgF/YER057c/UK114 family)